MFSALHWPGERRDWSRPRTNRSSLLSVTLLLTSSCKNNKKRDSQASPERCSTACVSLSLCAAVFSPLSFSLSSSPPSPPLPLFRSHLPSPSLRLSASRSLSPSFSTPPSLSPVKAFVIPILIYSSARG